MFLFIIMANVSEPSAAKEPVEGYNDPPILKYHKDITCSKCILLSGVNNPWTMLLSKAIKNTAATE